MSTSESSRRTLIAPFVLGLGLGGLFDGIVLHQILQWHHMLSAHTPPDSLANLEVNTVADGVFHASAWFFTCVGVFLLWGLLRGGTSFGWSHLVGGLLAGWGTFNVVEGAIDHHILGVHHVRPGPDQFAYDVGFMAWGALMIIAAVVLISRPQAAEP